MNDVEEMKKKIERSVMNSLADHEKNVIPRARKTLADIQALAPEYAKTCRALLDALTKEGFSNSDAMAIVQDYFRGRFLGV